jgi:hypothetical protein
MNRRILVAGAVTIGLAGAPALAAGVERSPPGGAYRKVSDLVKLPEFIPGLGTLYVDPKTLPNGPFLAYDHAGALVSTVYMIPLKDFETHRTIDALDAPGGNVDHVDMSYNAGHPGAAEPHYHVILWHIKKADEARVAK